MEKPTYSASRLTRLAQAASRSVTLIKQSLVSGTEYCFAKFARSSRQDSEEERMERERLLALAYSQLTAAEWAQVQADAAVAYEAWNRDHFDSMATFEEELSTMLRPEIDLDKAYDQLEEADLPEIVRCQDFYQMQFLAIQNDIAKDVRGRQAQEAATRRARHCLRCFNALRAKEPCPGNLYLYEISRLQLRIDEGESRARAYHLCIWHNRRKARELLELVDECIARLRPYEYLQLYYDSIKKAEPES
ncbi:MAG: hypothetical protein Q9191_007619 [Dirinaria sp. TL-2023a]